MLQIELPAKHAAQLNKAFSEKYKLPERQSYFGQLSFSQLNDIDKLEKVDIYTLITEDSRIAICRINEQLVPYTIEKPHPEFTNQKVIVKVVAVMRISYNHHDPITSKRFSQTSNYYVSEKMLDEVQRIITS